VACLVGEAIGAPGVGAMDLAAACAGFSYAASVADSMLESGAASRVLLIGADAMSVIVDQHDRSTAVLFGDGAGAVVLDPSEDESGFIDHILGADGRMASLGRAGHPGHEHKLHQNGREVFKFAVRILPEMVEQLLSRNGISLVDVQYIIPHQANARIIRAAMRKMEVPEEKVVMNLDRFGNTSAASIPLSYPDIYEKMEVGKYIVTVGFGFGLTWAANLYRI
jgi:3-oxoacyl-[acyl-carrier-protein] synthase-3